MHTRFWLQLREADEPDGNGVVVSDVVEGDTMTAEQFQRMIKQLNEYLKDVDFPFDIQAGGSTL